MGNWNVLLKVEKVGCLIRCIGFCYIIWVDGGGKWLFFIGEDYYLCGRYD